MNLIGKPLLIKLKKKNIGNSILTKAIDKLIQDIERAKWKTKSDVIETRNDADCVHSEGFYFFNIKIHRTMILIEFPDEEVILEENQEEENGGATVLWVGTHKEYDLTFKGNKTTIEKWLRSQGHIQ